MYVALKIGSFYCTQCECVFILYHFYRTSIPVKQEIENTEKKPTIRPKENRNFCERWLSLFSPWLTRCEDDSNRPFCRACQRPLDNNRFRLQRHERTAKHSRNQEILLNQGEDAVRLILSKCKHRKQCTLIFYISKCMGD